MRALIEPMARARRKNHFSTFSFNHSVLEMYSSAFLLSRLLRIDSYKHFLVEHYPEKVPIEPDLRGFTFAMSNVLYRQLLAAIHEPSVLGIAEDEGDNLLSTRMMWSRQGIRDLPGDSAHSHAARALVSGIRSMLGFTSWDQFTASVDPLIRFESVLCEFSERYVRVKYKGKQAPLSPKLMGAFGTFFAHVYLNDAQNVRFAYYDLTPAARSETLAQLRDLVEEWDDGGWDQAERFPMPNELMPSFAKAVSYIWHFWLGPEKYDKNVELFRTLGRCANWAEFDGFFSRMEEVTGRTPGVTPLNLLPGRAQGIEVERISDKEIDRLFRVIPPYRDKARTKLTVAEVFEYRPLRLLTDNNSIQGPAFFTTVFLGLLMHPSGDKVRILKLRHPKGRHNDISYAFFIPAFGSIMSNASEYWVLKNITDDSDHPDMTRAVVERFLKTFKDRVDLKEYELSESDLDQGLDHPVLRELLARDKSNRDLIASLQGNLLECLTAIHFVSRGFEIKGLRTKLRCMDNMEIDIAAARQSNRDVEILLAQCKGRLARPMPIVDLSTMKETIPQDPEMSKVLRFSRQVSRVAGAPSDLLRELELHRLNGIVRIRGLVLSTNISRKDLRSFPRNLELWTSEEWATEFRKDGLPSSIFEPIERIIRRQSPGFRILDYWET